MIAGGYLDLVWSEWLLVGGPFSPRSTDSGRSGHEVDRVSEIAVEDDLLADQHFRGASHVEAGQGGCSGLDLPVELTPVAHLIAAQGAHGAVLVLAFGDHPAVARQSYPVTPSVAAGTPQGQRSTIPFRTDGRVQPGWLSGQCRHAGISPQVAFRFVADLSATFGIAVHDEYADTLASPAPPEVVRQTWDAVHARVEELTSEILEQLT